LAVKACKLLYLMKFEK